MLPLPNKNALTIDVQQREQHLTFKVKGASSPSIVKLQQNFNGKTLCSPISLLPEIYLKIINVGAPRNLYQAKRYFHILRRVNKAWKGFARLGMIAWINRFHAVLGPELMGYHKSMEQKLNYIKICGMALKCLKIQDRSQFGFDAYTNLTDEQISVIVQCCPNITCISLPRSNITNLAIEIIFTGLKDLEQLKVHNCKKVTQIPKWPAALQVLRLSWIENMTRLNDDSPENLRKLRLVSMGSHQTFPLVPEQYFSQLPGWICKQNLVLGTLILDNIIHLNLPVNFELPERLEILRVTGNTSINTWPALPTALRKFQIENMEYISELPLLHEGLLELKIFRSGNRSLKMPESLPTTLLSYAADCHVAHPQFPAGLKILTFYGNSNEELPCPLPEGLVYLGLPLWGKRVLLPEQLPLSLEAIYHHSNLCLCYRPKVPQREPSITVEYYKPLKLRDLKNSRWYRESCKIQNSKALD